MSNPLSTRIFRCVVAAAFLGSSLVASAGVATAAEGESSKQTVCVHKKKGTVKVFAYDRKCPKTQVELVFTASTDGEPGSPGVPGSTGSTGPIGSVGPAGITGATGSAGATGATGLQGSPGIGTVWSGSDSGPVTLSTTSEYEIARIDGVPAGDYLVIPTIAITQYRSGVGVIFGGNIWCSPRDTGSAATGPFVGYWENSDLVYSSASLITLNSDDTVTMTCKATDGSGNNPEGTLVASGSFYLIPVSDIRP